MSRFLLHPEDDSELEASVFEVQLRAAAPTLPPALRSRTLMRCATERESRRRNRRRGQVRWAWTIAGLCAFHWGAMSYLDAQSAALIHGKQPVPYMAATATAAEWRVALAAHSRLLARITQETNPPLKASRDAG